jgi:hypothetical protein
MTKTFLTLPHEFTNLGVCPIRGGGLFGLLKAHADSEYIYFIEVWIKIGLFMLKNRFVCKIFLF